MSTRRQKARKAMILIAFFAFPAVFYYLSPVLIIEASAKGIVNGSFVVFMVLFTASLFVGRAYCGWACPGAGCQESVFPARPRAVTGGNYVKWLVWVPWVGAIVAAAVRAGGYHRLDFFYRTTHGMSVTDTGSLMSYLVVLFLLIALPAFVVGKRSFCHHLCWMAPFMIAGRGVRNRVGWGALQLRPEPEACTGCGACSRQCPMSLPVQAMVKRGNMENPECILCGACVDACRHNAISYEWSRRQPGGKTAARA